MAKRIVIDAEQLLDTATLKEILQKMGYVEVVRCKDCWYRNGTPGQPNIPCYQMHEDDFCSYGERREDEIG